MQDMHRLGGGLFAQASCHSRERRLLPTGMQRIEDMSDSRI